MAQPTILDSEHVIDDYTRHQLQLRHPPGHDLRGHEDNYKPIVSLGSAPMKYTLELALEDRVDQLYELPLPRSGSWKYRSSLMI